ncbi:hypothetical protein [Singulisphaera sp. PoT]|uniref:hypothetical protein n=1 Tax=Singulisphaera sp. PoT TaxID=3411797 RepID=UPI003BF5C86E
MWQKRIKYLNTAGLSPEAVAAIEEFDLRQAEFERREFELDGQEIEDLALWLYEAEEALTPFLLEQPGHTIRHGGRTYTAGGGLPGLDECSVLCREIGSLVT